MKVTFLAALFLPLLISTSIQSNGQAHDELLGKLYGNGSIEDTTKLNNKDVFVISKNEHKHELSVTIRKGGGGGGGGGGGRGEGSGSGAGAAAAVGAGAGAGAGGMRGGHHHNAASTIFPETHFWVPYFTLYLSLALTTLFLSL